MSMTMTYNQTVTMPQNMTSSKHLKTSKKENLKNLKTSNESLIGNVDDNEVQPNSTDASKDDTSEESPKGNGKRSSENTFGNFCKKFKFWKS